MADNAKTQAIELLAGVLGAEFNVEFIESLDGAQLLIEWPDGAFIVRAARMDLSSQVAFRG